MTTLESAAVAYIVARRAMLDAVKARNGSRCENETDSQPDWESGNADPGEPPCWKAEGVNRDGEPDALRKEFYCAPCKARQAVHETLPSLRAKSTGALRRLERLAREVAP